MGQGQGALAATQNPPVLTQTIEFQAFIASLWPRAREKGVSAKTFGLAFTGVTPDPSLRLMEKSQPEFERPLSAYLAEAVSIARFARGRAELQKHRLELAEIEQRFGVPGEIILSIWSLESDFGRVQGQKDMIRSLATLGFLHGGRSLYIDELLNALIILEEGKVPREKLKSSWAGAMGAPQFLPSAYLKYAIAFTDDGAPDIWGKTADIFASIANFLSRSGWRPGLPWGFEVVLPQNFSFLSLHQSFTEFASEGLRSADGRAFPADGQATLFLPAGAAGPAFLLSDNYWVLKAYNNSDSYALSLSLLANRMAGASPLRTKWPSDEKLLSHSQKVEMQRLLAKLDLYSGPEDGRFGQASRDAIHAFQMRLKSPTADGYGTQELLDQLLKVTSSVPQ
jgi:lytic murein transglycosylase